MKIDITRIFNRLLRRIYIWTLMYYMGRVYYKVAKVGDNKKCVM
jgi:hypothetical protein